MGMRGCHSLGRVDYVWVMWDRNIESSPLQHYDGGDRQSEAMRL